MIIVDENIVQGQRQRLRELKIHFRQIGFELGWRGMRDRNDVIPLLHSLRRPTFFTRDVDYYKTDLLHAGYCLVYLDVVADEAADYANRFLRQPAFRTQTQRLGKVIRVRPIGLSWWESGKAAEHALSW